MTSFSIGTYVQEALLREALAFEYSEVQEVDLLA